MSLSLQGKGAIVTGGSRGIGAEVARELARQGASVLVTYAKSVAEAQKVVAELETIQPHGCAAQYKAVQADAANAQQAAEITVVEAKELFRGKIDIIVNNAANGLDLPLDELTTENFDSMFHTNVLFPCLLIKLSKPSLARNARIVNVSTVSARIAYATGVTYGASKAALESVTRSLAQDLGHDLGVTVNAINPGPVRTQMWHEMENTAVIEELVKGRTLAGPRIGEVDDIAPIVAFLCQEQSRWVTGSVVNANGGLVPV